MAGVRPARRRSRSNHACTSRSVSSLPIPYDIAPPACKSSEGKSFSESVSRLRQGPPPRRGRRRVQPPAATCMWRRVRPPRRCGRHARASPRERRRNSGWTHFGVPAWRGVPLFHNAAIHEQEPTIRNPREGGAHPAGALDIRRDCGSSILALWAAVPVARRRDGRSRGPTEISGVTASLSRSRAHRRSGGISRTGLAFGARLLLSVSDGGRRAGGTRRSR